MTAPADPNEACGFCGRRTDVADAQAAPSKHRRCHLIGACE